MNPKLETKARDILARGCSRHLLPEGPISNGMENYSRPAIQLSEGDWQTLRDFFAGAQDLIKHLTASVHSWQDIAYNQRKEVEALKAQIERLRGMPAREWAVRKSSAHGYSIVVDSQGQSPFKMAFPHGTAEEIASGCNAAMRQSPGLTAEQCAEIATRILATPDEWGNHYDLAKRAWVERFLHPDAVADEGYRRIIAALAPYLATAPADPKSIAETMEREPS